MKGYTKKQNNRRYKLHWKCRQKGVGIVVKSKTCCVLYRTEINENVKRLVEEFNYGIQFVMFLNDKRVKNGK